MDVALWTFGLSLVAIIGGVARYLLAYYFKSQKEIQDLRASYAASSFKNLQTTIENHKNTLHHLNSRLTTLESELKLAILKLEDVKLDVTETNSWLKEFVNKTEDKMEKLASENVKIAKEVVMIKSKKI